MCAQSLVTGDVSEINLQMHIHDRERNTFSLIYNLLLNNLAPIWLLVCTVKDKRE